MENGSSSSGPGGGGGSGPPGGVSGSNLSQSMDSVNTVPGEEEVSLLSHILFDCAKYTSPFFLTLPPVGELRGGDTKCLGI